GEADRAAERGEVAPARPAVGVLDLDHGVTFEVLAAMDERAGARAEGAWLELPVHRLPLHGRSRDLVRSGPGLSCPAVPALACLWCPSSGVRFVAPLPFVPFGECPVRAQRTTDSSGTPP